MPNAAWKAGDQWSTATWERWNNARPYSQSPGRAVPTPGEKVLVGLWRSFNDRPGPPYDEKHVYRSCLEPSPLRLGIKWPGSSTRRSHQMLRQVSGKSYDTPPPNYRGRIRSVGLSNQDLHRKEPGGASRPPNNSSQRAEVGGPRPIDRPGLSQASQNHPMGEEDQVDQFEAVVDCAQKKYSNTICDGGVHYVLSEISQGIEQALEDKKTRLATQSGDCPCRFRRGKNAATRCL